jgi:lipopolysaccharide export system protein LptC
MKMLKRVIVLAILLSILFALFLVKSQTNTPVSNQGNDSSEYKMVEYTITEIIENQYYGKREDGTKIVFSAESFDSSVKIQVDDVVIVFFEKDNVGKGLVKVEKK